MTAAQLGMAAPSRSRGPLGVPQAASDEALLKRIAGGEASAMRVLFARHHVGVYRFVLRMVQDTALAEDLTSEAFLYVWRQAGQFGGRSAAKTWLLAIARYKALAALRRRPEQGLDEQTAAKLADPADDPETLVRKEDRSAMLRKCLTALSQEHREVIDLVYCHERSVRDVAEIVGIPEGTAKTRVFYARKQLGALLRAAGMDCATA